MHCTYLHYIRDINLTRTSYYNNKAIIMHNVMTITECIPAPSERIILIGRTISTHTNMQVIDESHAPGKLNASPPYKPTKLAKNLFRFLDEISRQQSACPSNLLFATEIFGGLQLLALVFLSLVLSSSRKSLGRAFRRSKARWATHGWTPRPNTWCSTRSPPPLQGSG